MIIYENDFIAIGVDTGDSLIIIKTPIIKSVKIKGSIDQSVKYTQNKTLLTKPVCRYHVPLYIKPRVIQMNICSFIHYLI